MKDQEKIPVLKETEVRRRAREKAEGDWRNAEISLEVLEDIEDSDEYEYPSPSDHGRWDRGILPQLRRIAGYGDTYGNYNEKIYVAFIAAEDEDDEPPVAEVVESYHILNEVVMQEYNEKMYDVLQMKVEESLKYL